MNRTPEQPSRDTLPHWQLGAFGQYVLACYGDGQPNHDSGGLPPLGGPEQEVVTESLSSIVPPDTPEPVVISPEEAQRFEALYALYSYPLYQFISHMVRDRDRAWDYLHDTFVNAYTSLAAGTQVSDEKVKAWLYRIAYNRVVDVLRKEKYLKDKHMDAVPLPNDEAYERDKARSDPALLTNTTDTFEELITDRDILNEALKLLKPDVAACLVLHLGQGFSLAEVGEILHKSVGSVSMNITRAKRTIIDSGIKWSP